jgi:uncharacterized protein
MTVLQSVTVAWLRAGGPWREVPEVVETHAAVVFLVGTRAYKLKKAVDLGYLDFSSTEKRRMVLERELVLNRRTAPGIYLRTLPIVHLADGSLALGTVGEVVDWVLEMKRFPNENVLARVAQRGDLSEAMIESLAAVISDFHDHAESVSDCDWPSAMSRIALENKTDLESNVTVLGNDRVEAANRACADAMQRCTATLRQQSSDVRHCHGDLHLGNIYLDGQQPTLFDCIEFDDFYATIPPLYDLAFLLSDLYARDLRRLANRLLNVWLVHRDPGHWRNDLSSLDALPLYLGSRLAVRAKVEARTPGGDVVARRYLEMIPQIVRPGARRLLAIGGLSGSGKSSLAKDLAWRLGAVGGIHLRSDEIRKRMAGIGVFERLPASAYTKEASDRVYAELGDLARAALASGQAVVVDAVFSSEEERTGVAAIAAETNAPFMGFWLEAPRELLARRIASRHHDASDASAEVLHSQLAYDLGDVSWDRLDATGSQSDVSALARRRLGI